MHAFVYVLLLSLKEITMHIIFRKEVVTNTVLVMGELVEGLKPLTVTFKRYVVDHSDSEVGGT